jgi:hypothetical protein
MTTYTEPLPDPIDNGPLPIPLDVTGELPIPETPLSVGPGGGKKARLWQKGRKLLLRKPVLVVVLGRQLAGPTKDALNLISSGVPVNPSDITGAASAPASVPSL